MSHDNARDRLPTAGDLVRAFGRPAKKSLGQHFLTDPGILNRLVDLAKVHPGDLVLEIGAGPGTLTRTLLARDCRVLAIEIDEAAASFLRETIIHPGLQVVQGDILTLDLDVLLSERVRVVSNLPYQAATEIFFSLEHRDPIADMTLMFQREVSRRFTAHPGNKSFGPLALLSGIRWFSKLVMNLPPGAFHPPPRVNSAAVRFERRLQPAVAPEHESTYRKLVKTAFTQRRKQIHNALSGLVRLDQLQAAQIDPQARPETLGVAKYERLAQIVGDR